MPLSRPSGPANRRWYSWCSDRYQWRGPPASSGMYPRSQSEGLPTHLIERHVQALIVQTAAQRLKLLTELPRVSSHHMRCESLLVPPYFYDRAMVLPTALLQHLKAHVAVIAAAGLGQLLQQKEGFILAGRHCVGVGHDIRGSCGTYGQRGTNRESFVETIIEGADTQRLQLFAQLYRVRGHTMGVKGLLVLPRFQEHKMVRSTVLLQHLKPHIAFLLAARLTVLSEESYGLTLGRWHDFDVGHRIDGSIARFIGARCVRQA